MTHDDRFKSLKKAFYHFLKAHHHLTNIRISDGTTKEPPGLVRTMRNLESVIKPANPNPTSQLMLYGNARNWLHTSLQILENHYEKSIREGEITIKQLAGNDWEEALTIAIRWTKKNLKKVNNDTILEASKKITEFLQGHREPDPLSKGNIEPEVIEHLTPSLEPSRKTRKRAQNNNQKRAQATIQTTNWAKKPRGEEHNPMEGETNPPNGETSANPNPGTELSSLHTKENHRREVVLSLGPTEPKRMDGCFTDEDFPPLPAPQGPPLIPQIFLTNKQNPRPPSTKNSCVVKNMGMGIEPYPFSGTETKKTPHMKPLETPERMIIVHQPHPEDPSQSSKSPTTPIEEEVDFIVPNQELNLLVEEPGQSYFYIDMRTPPPSFKPTSFKPTRHLNTKRKMVDWGLVAKRKWLIMGDSNLSRIPSFQTPDMQIESYPGATFLHAEVLMKKTKMMIKVEKVVLSFGINNKNQKLKETAMKQLQKAVKAAKEKFPYAEIWVPQINYCKNLPVDQQLTLNNLNTYIGKNMGHIPLLPDEVFSVNRDLVHWTTDTAKAMLEHWMKYLNCSTP